MNPLILSAVGKMLLLLFLYKDSVGIKKKNTNADIPFNNETKTHTLLPILYHIYPTPPLGQDMTQGQFFLSGV